MCVQYRGGCHYREGCSVPWGYHEYRGDILSTVGYIMSTVRVILSTVAGVQHHGRYHDARGGYHENRGGCSIPWGKKLLLFEYPTVLNTPTVLMISPHLS